MKIIFAASAAVCAFAIGCSAETDIAWTEYVEETNETNDAGSDGPVSISDDKDAGNP
jgi:hypothetical protein